VYKHALEEVEVPLGDEGSSCERRKVQEEAGGLGYGCLRHV
jgi:hypothetical protein